MKDKNEEEMEQYTEDDDDAVILTGCGQISQWIWPKNMNICQVRTCHTNFKNRWEAMNHFREQHANVSILCPLCDKPIYAPTPHLFKRHYERKHPNLAMPFDFNVRRHQAAKSKGQTKKV